MVFAPMVGREDSTVVGILRRSPACGDRVGESVQGRSVSEGQNSDNVYASRDHSDILCNVLHT